MNRSLLLKLVSGFVVFGAWEIAGRIPVSYAFPTFFESMAALKRMAFDGSLWQAYGETLKPLAIGVLISAVTGIAIGLWAGLASGLTGCFHLFLLLCRLHPWPP